MAALKATISIFSKYLSSSSILLYPKSSGSVKLHSSFPTTNLSHNSLSCPLILLYTNTDRNFRFEVCSAVQEVTIEEETEQTQETNLRRKLHAVNLPWSFSAVDIKDLFGQCGTVKGVELVKQKDGRNRGFAFVTMASEEEAQAVVDKLDSHEVSGRIIRVAFAKRFEKPCHPRAPAGETDNKIYVSNLAWKVRSNNLNEFFSTNFNPVSARVVFENSSRRPAGYGFVSFSTMEEAEAAISALDGKDLRSMKMIGMGTEQDSLYYFTHTKDSCCRVTTSTPTSQLWLRRLGIDGPTTSSKVQSEEH